MNKLVYKIAILLIAVSLVSCEKGLMNFDNEKVDVYFFDAGRTYAPNVDSTYVSFTYITKPDTLKDVVVAITGLAADHDREYKVAVNQSSTAIAGVHYQALPEKFVMKKSALRDTFKVKLSRTADMKTNSYVLVLDLLPTESFGTSWTTRLIGGKPISTIKYKIRIDDVVKKPKYWLDGPFGTWSRTKMFFILDFLHLPGDYMETPRNVGELNSYGKIVKRELDRLTSLGQPVLDENGKPMTMGTGSN